jgi:hypothetical protein
MRARCPQMTALVVAAALASAGRARAQDPQAAGEPADNGEPGVSHEYSIAMQLQNPVANLTSVPLQNNFEFGGGSNDDFGYTLNLQPIVPFPLGDLLLISRTILPVIDQPEVAPGSGREFGLGDLTQSFFFAPAVQSQVIWGIGPALLLPTATDDRLGAGKWGAGPTGVALLQSQGWTVGALANHIWSIGGDDDRGDVNATFVQPFVAYTLPSALTFTVQSETTYDWRHEQWTIPVAAGATQLVKLGELPVSFGLFGRYWFDGDDLAPDWSVRVPITFVLPPLGPPPKREAVVSTAARPLHSRP